MGTHSGDDRLSEEPSKEAIAALNVIYPRSTQSRVRDAVAGGRRTAADNSCGSYGEDLSLIMPAFAAYLSPAKRSALQADLADSINADAAGVIGDLVYKNYWPKPPCPQAADTLVALHAMEDRVDRRAF